MPNQGTTSDSSSSPHAHDGDASQHSTNASTSDAELRNETAQSPTSGSPPFERRRRKPRVDPSTLLKVISTLDNTLEEVAPRENLQPRPDAAPEQNSTPHNGPNIRAHEKEPGLDQELSQPPPVSVTGTPPDESVPEPPPVSTEQSVAQTSSQETVTSSPALNSSLPEIPEDNYHGLDEPSVPDLLRNVRKRVAKADVPVPTTLGDLQSEVRVRPFQSSDAPSFLDDANLFLTDEASDPLWDDELAQIVEESVVFLETSQTDPWNTPKEDDLTPQPQPIPPVATSFPNPGFELAPQVPLAQPEYLRFHHDTAESSPSPPAIPQVEATPTPTPPIPKSEDPAPLPPPIPQEKAAPANAPIQANVEPAPLEPATPLAPPVRTSSHPVLTDEDDDLFEMWFEHTKQDVRVEDTAPSPAPDAGRVNETLADAVLSEEPLLEPETSDTAPPPVNIAYFDSLESSREESSEIEFFDSEPGTYPDQSGAFSWKFSRKLQLLSGALALVLMATASAVALTDLSRLGSWISSSTPQAQVSRMDVMRAMEFASFIVSNALGVETDELEPLAENITAHDTENDEQPAERTRSIFDELAPSSSKPPTSAATAIPRIERLIERKQFKQARQMIIYALKSFDEYTPELLELFNKAILLDNSLIDRNVHTVALDATADLVTVKQQRPRIVLSIEKHDSPAYTFTPDQSGNSSYWRADIAAYRLCEIVVCHFSIPRTIPARISREELTTLLSNADPDTRKALDTVAAKFNWTTEALSDGSVRDYLYGSLSEQVDSKAHWPIEYTSVWREWLRGSEDVLSTPLSVSLKAYQSLGGGRYYENLQAQAANAQTLHLARQISSLLAFDFLTNNWERFSRRDTSYGAYNVLQRGSLVSIHHDLSFQPRASRRVDDRFKWTSRLSKDTVTSLRALEPEIVSPILFPDATGSETTRLNVFWRQHRDLLKRVDQLVARHGSEAVFFTD